MNTYFVVNKSVAKSAKILNFSDFLFSQAGVEFPPRIEITQRVLLHSDESECNSCNKLILVN